MNIEHLSYSSIKQYIDCGLQFRFRKIDQIKPEYTSDNLILGSCIHKALAKFNQHRAENKTVKATELGEWYEGYFTGAVQNNGEIKYSNSNDFQSCLILGKNLLEVFHNHNQNNEYQVLEIEKEFSLQLEGFEYPIIGFIDLLETDNAGNILVTEYKTAAKAYSTTQIDLNEQVTLYDLAMQSLYPDKQIITKLDCLIKTKKPKFEQYYTHRDQDDHNRFIKTAKAVARGIESEVFIPNTSSWKCAYCEYQNFCSDWLKS